MLEAHCLVQDVFAADTACTFLCVSLFGAGVSLLGLLLEETVPRVLLFRYLVTPCVSLLTLILLSSRVRGNVIETIVIMKSVMRTSY